MPLQKLKFAYVHTPLPHHNTTHAHNQSLRRADLSKCFVKEVVLRENQSIRSSFLAVSQHICNSVEAPNQNILFEQNTQKVVKHEQVSYHMVTSLFLTAGKSYGYVHSPPAAQTVPFT